jgi:hypothetical protein
MSEVQLDVAPTGAEGAAPDASSVPSADSTAAAAGSDAARPPTSGSAKVDELVAEARRAHSAGDAAASKAAHDEKAAVLAAEEVHGGSGADYIKSIVFGGLDGELAVIDSRHGSLRPMFRRVLSSTMQCSQPPPQT